MKVLRAADYRRMPWRNGGGVTTELFVSPDAGRFSYRVSIADVASDGPFSRFEGYDRHIVLVAGRGMKLNEHRLEPLVPFAFSGDDDITGTLEDGPVRDFNLIVDRARGRGQLDTVRLPVDARQSFAADEVCIVHVLAGALDVAAAGETVVGQAFTVTAREDTTLIVARVAR